MSRSDFNGDGRDDVLWLHDQPLPYALPAMQWLSRQDGTFAFNADAVYPIISGWLAVGTGDFNGDGFDDILWQHLGRTLTNWLGQAGGTFFSNHDAFFDRLNTLRVVGTGDFNDDSLDDLLLRNDEGDVGYSKAAAGGIFDGLDVSYGLPLNWNVLGTGDFDADGHDDVLLRHDSGLITEWLGGANGTFFSNHAVATYALDTAWEVQGIGDFNGDGFDDVLLRHANGTVTEWLANGASEDGAFTWNSAAVYALPLTWHIQPDPNAPGDWYY